MKIIMLSIDKSILRDGSEAQERMKEYGSIAEELHIIVYTDTGFKERKISENAWVYPTNTVFKLFYFFNAYRIAKRIIRNSSFIINNSLITSQDAFTNIVAFFLKKKFGLSLQAQIHTDFLSPFFKSESWKNYIRYLLYPRTIKKATPSPKPKAMQLVPEALLAMHWRPLFETRRYQKELLKKVGEGFYLPPYRVLVFESRLSWRSSRPKTWP